MLKILFFCLKLRYFNDFDCKLYLTFSPLSKELGLSNIIWYNSWILDILLYFDLEISNFNLFLIWYLIISILILFILINWNVFSIIIYIIIQFKLLFPFIINYLDNNIILMKNSLFEIKRNLTYEERVCIFQDICKKLNINNLNFIDNFNIRENLGHLNDKIMIEEVIISSFKTYELLLYNFNTYKSLLYNFNTYELLLCNFNTNYSYFDLGIFTGTLVIGILLPSILPLSLPSLDPGILLTGILLTGILPPVPPVPILLPVPPVPPVPPVLPPGFWGQLSPRVQFLTILFVMGLCLEFTDYYLELNSFELDLYNQNFDYKDWKFYIRVFINGFFRVFYYMT